jgi:hypothetical protein
MKVDFLGMSMDVVSTFKIKNGKLTITGPSVLDQPGTVQEYTKA